MNPRPAVMFWLNELTNPIERYAPPSAASTPDSDDGGVAGRVDRDPDRVGGARMLADRADAQPDRRLEEHDPGGDDVRNASQIIRFSSPSTGPTKYQSSRKPRWTFGIVGMSGGVPSPP